MVSPRRHSARARVRHSRSPLVRAIAGIATDPQVVAAVRGLLLLALPIGVEAAVAWSQHWPGAFAVLAPATALVMRALEGALDRYLKGAGQND